MTDSVYPALVSRVRILLLLDLDDQTNVVDSFQWLSGFTVSYPTFYTQRNRLRLLNRFFYLTIFHYVEIKIYAIETHF